MNRILILIIIALLLCGIGLAYNKLAIMPQANNTSDNISQVIYPQNIPWAGQRDMSNYSNYNPPNVTKPVFDEEWLKSHPGAVILNQSKFPQNMTIIHMNGTQIPSNSTMIYDIPAP